MPKLHRNKMINRSRKEKHGLQEKKKLFKEIQACIDTYAHVFVLSVKDMWNSNIKSIQEKWNTSRFFIGRNKILAKALGRTEGDEYRCNLHKISERLTGHRFLLFTNEETEEVLNWFSSHTNCDYANPGDAATEDVILDEGSYPDLRQKIGKTLKKLGLPISIKKDVVYLTEEHIVCKAGDTLSAKTAKILKLFGYQMAEFQVNIECVWSQDGSFVDFKSNTEYLTNFSKDDADTAAAIENETQPDAAEMIKMTKDKVKAIERSAKKVQKFSPKMLRGRASPKQPATPAIEKGVKRLKEDNEDTGAAIDDETRPDPAEMIKMTEEKVKAIERSTKKVQKISPKMLRGRASTIKPATPAIEKGVKRLKEDNEDTGAAIEDEAQPDPAEMIKMTKDKVKAIERSAKKVQKFSPKMLRGRVSTVKSATSADENSVKISKDDNAETAAEMMKMTEDKIKAIERTPPKYSPKLTRGKAAAMSEKKSAPTAAVQSAKKSAKKRKAV